MKHKNENKTGTLIGTLVKDENDGSVWLCMPLDRSDARYRDHAAAAQRGDARYIGIRVAKYHHWYIKVKQY